MAFDENHGFRDFRVIYCPYVSYYSPKVFTTNQHMKLMHRPVVLLMVNILVQSYNSETRCTKCCGLLCRKNQVHPAMATTSDLHKYQFRVDFFVLCHQI